MERQRSGKNVHSRTTRFILLDAWQVNVTILATTDSNPDTISTVNVNLVKYNQPQVKDSHVARYFQNTAGLSTRVFLKMIDSGAMKNSPIIQ